MEIKCRFSYDLPDNPEFKFFGHGKYICFVESAHISKRSTRIKLFDGKHVQGRSDIDVDGIVFNGAKINFFPRGLYKIFKRLKILWMTNCELKELSENDLNAFQYLEVVGFDNNQLTSLPDDLFMYLDKLEVISFKSNKLTHLSSALFNWFTIREEVGNVYNRVSLNKVIIRFENNPTINSSTDATSKFPDLIPKPVTVTELMESIEKNCCKPIKELSKHEAGMEELSKGFKDFWSSGLFSDFLIKVESKEFRVHKNILAIQSSVFLAMFENGMSESQTNQMTINDFGADTVYELLNYFYTGQILDDNNAVETYTIAVKYDVEDLKLICEEIILLNLNKSNAYEIFTLGHSHSSEKLKQEAFNEILMMFPDKTLPTHLKDHPGNLKEMIDAKCKYELSVLETETEYESFLNQLKFIKRKSELSLQ